MERRYPRPLTPVREGTKWRRGKAVCGVIHPANGATSLRFRDGDRLTGVGGAMNLPLFLRPVPSSVVCRPNSGLHEQIPVGMRRKRLAYYAFAFICTMTTLSRHVDWAIYRFTNKKTTVVP
ncbi:hypothetical protein SKAU_G00358440 [Synaphobranchus kaupii]|uniref:Uncharacterized protein n=1 Tax=Synaphobranchus kaupii TaxID=118154 RepID=A0A9Q1IEQ4_SYNKA|nr:hypothetical protein SKAU_G00358440 [Synaphobranchus kaupii]